MKSLILVVLLAVAATAAVIDNQLSDVVEVLDGTELVDEGDEQELTGVTGRLSLSLGTISGVLVYSRQFTERGIPNQALRAFIPVSAGNRRITAIRVIRVGTSQNAIPSVVSGGIGQNYVDIRIASAVGRGYDYIVNVYAE